MIYVDSCIPMYLVGASHPLKSRVIELLPSTIHSDELVTSAETFQEIIHRFKALADLVSLGVAYEALEAMVTKTVDVRKVDVDMARSFTGQFPGLSSRDCLHLAAMKQLRCTKIWTYDAKFDLVPSIERVQ